MYKPRPYQQDAIDCALDWIKKSYEPCLIEATTGSGKSIIVAHIAQWINDNHGKKVLCLAPSRELTAQNFEKFEAIGGKASFFSASLGKSLRHPIVFGTPKTVLNQIKAFQCGNFSCVIIDEAHQITPTIKSIVEKMRESNPNLRVIGLSATPYRLNDGYIFRYWHDGRPVDSDQTKDPFFHSLVYRITAHELIGQGFLTQPHADPDHAESYDTSGIKRHTVAEYEKAFEGKGRKTAEIIADVVAHSQNRMGVMIFAATVRHAQEIMASLPPENSRMIGGSINMGKSERNKIVNDFKSMKYKYLVNVATMTTGVDFTHVDVIAILRATESASLLQQIIGRALRIHPEKTDALILDYAENIERHQLESDFFTPIIKARIGKKGEPIDVTCPLCSTINSFSMRPNKDEFPIDQDGYFVDLMGERVKDGETGSDIPAHLGRRCFGYSIIKGKSIRCEHRWSIKECPDCQHENDIAARFCESCKAELVDPNEKLVIDFKRMKANPRAVNTDNVLSMVCYPHKSNAGNMTIRANFVTEYRKFSIWLMPDSHNAKKRAEYEQFSKAVYKGRVAPDIDTFMAHIGKATQPKTITYQKINDFYTVYGYNNDADKMPD